MVLEDSTTVRSGSGKNYEDSTCLNPFDGDENGSLVAADVVHLRFPHLAKVALPQHLQALEV